MKKVGAIVLILLISLVSIGALPPLRMGGQDSSQLKPGLVVRAPYSQVTDLGGVNKLIETGNENPLVNASFESVTVDEGWTVTPTAGVETSGVFGNQSLKVTPVAENVSITQTVTKTAYINKMIEGECQIKSDIGNVEVCLYDGTSDLQCKQYDGSNDWKKVKAYAGTTTGIIGMKIKADNATGTLLVDNCKVQEMPVDGTTKVLTQSFGFHGDSATMTSRAAGTPLKFGVLATKGSNLLTYTDGNGQFTATRDVRVTGVLSSTSGTTVSLQVKKNNTQLQVQSGSANSEQAVPFTVDLVKDDYLTFETAIALLGQANLDITATAYEQATVLAQSGFSGASIRWHSVANCLFSTGSTTYVDNFDTDCTFASAQKTGAAIAPTTTGGLALKIASLPSGKYKLEQFGGKLITNVDGSSCYWRIIDHNGTELANVFQAASSGIADNAVPDMSVVVEYNTHQTNAEFKLQSYRAGGTAGCQSRADVSGRSLGISLTPIAQDIIGTFKPAVNSSIRKGADAITFTSGTAYFLDFPTLDYDPDNNFEGCSNGTKTTSGTPTTCKYVVPENGIYAVWISYSISDADFDEGEELEIIARVNNVSRCGNYHRGSGNFASNIREVVDVSCILNLNKGDIIEANASHAAIGGLDRDTLSSYNFFNVHKVDQAGVINEVAKNAVKTQGVDNPVLYSCRIDNGGTASINNESGLCDFIQSTNRVSAGVVDIVFKSNKFTLPPVCTCSSRNATNQECITYDTTASGAQFRTYTAAGGADDANFYFICHGK